MESASSSAADPRPLTKNALCDTLDYTSKLMATIQEMSEQSDLKFKVSKFAAKIKKLQRQLCDERALAQRKTASLDLLNGELTKTNLESERIERENRKLKASLRELEDVQQRFRLLEMRGVQMAQQHRAKDAEAAKLRAALQETRAKLQRPPRRGVGIDAR